MFISVPSFYDTFLVFLNASYEANYAPWGQWNILTKSCGIIDY